MTTAIDTEILKLFCDEDRKGLKIPWSIGRWTFASNGRVLVRTKRISSVATNRGAPKITGAGNVGEVFDRIPEKWIPLKKVISRNRTTKIGKSYFDVKFLNMFQVFENVEIGTFGKLDTARVRFSGGEGLIQTVYLPAEAEKT